MKKLLVLMLVLLLMPLSSAYAWDFFGGITDILSSDDDVVYGVGEQAETDNIQVKLIKVMSSNGNAYNKPVGGKEFVLVQFEFTNTSDEDVALSTMLSFETWVDGELYVIDTDALAVAMLAGMPQCDTVIEPGKKFTGVVGYQVPKAWKEFKIIYSEELFFGDKLTFVFEH